MSEIIEVENWEWRWCNKITGMPIVGGPTGSYMSACPPEQYARRYIQLGTKRIHENCDGLVVKKFDSKWVGSVSYQKFWEECQRCGKRWNETEFE